MLFFAIFLVDLTLGKDPGQKKLEEMEKLEAQTADSIIFLNKAQYAELVIENPRPYHVVMLYTVKQGCNYCQAMYSEFQTAIFSFKQQEEKLPLKTFYAVLFHNYENSVHFQMHNFNTVPYMTVSLAAQKRNPEKEFYQEEDIWYVRQD